MILARFFYKPVTVIHRKGRIITNTTISYDRFNYARTDLENVLGQHQKLSTFEERAVAAVTCSVKENVVSNTTSRYLNEMTCSIHRFTINDNRTNDSSVTTEVNSLFVLEML